MSAAPCALCLLRCAVPAVLCSALPSMLYCNVLCMLCCALLCSAAICCVVLRCVALCMRTLRHSQARRSWPFPSALAAQGHCSEGHGAVQLPLPTLPLALPLTPRALKPHLTAAAPTATITTTMHTHTQPSAPLPTPVPLPRPPLGRSTVKKNKVSAPYKQAEFDILFGSGISANGCMLDAGARRQWWSCL